MKYQRGKRGKPWHFLDFSKGKGSAIINEDEYETNPKTKEKREQQTLSEPYILAIKGLGQFERFQAASEFRKLIEKWYISNFFIQEARQRRESEIAEHLSETGDNLPIFAQYMFENHKEQFNKVIEEVKEKIHGIEEVKPEKTGDGHLFLRFKHESFKKSFIARNVSDGTLCIFAYLLLLNDPLPVPLLAIEEPENQLYPHLLEILAEEFRAYASRPDSKSKSEQIFVSTHSPDFLNALEPKELFVLRKKEDGFSEILHASEIELVRDLRDEGDQLGYLWRERLLKKRGGLI